LADLKVGLRDVVRTFRFAVQCPDEFWPTASQWNVGAYSRGADAHSVSGLPDPPPRTPVV